MAKTEGTSPHTVETIPGTAMVQASIGPLIISIGFFLLKLQRKSYFIVPLHPLLTFDPIW